MKETQNGFAGVLSVIMCALVLVVGGYYSYKAPQLSGINSQTGTTTEAFSVNLSVSSSTPSVAIEAPASDVTTVPDTKPTLTDQQIQMYDARTMSTLANLRAEAELSYSENNDSYSKVCSGKNVLTNLLNSKDIFGSPYKCKSNSTSWYVSVVLRNKTAGSWCSDGTGYSGYGIGSYAGSVYSCKKTNPPASTLRVSTATVALTPEQAKVVAEGQKYRETRDKMAAEMKKIGDTLKAQNPDVFLGLKVPDTVGPNVGSVANVQARTTIHDLLLPACKTVFSTMEEQEKCAKDFTFSFASNLASEKEYYVAAHAAENQGTERLPLCEKMPISMYNDGKLVCYKRTIKSTSMCPYFADLLKIEYASGKIPEQSILLNACYGFVARNTRTPNACFLMTDDINPVYSISYKDSCISEYTLDKNDCAKIKDSATTGRCIDKINAYELRKQNGY